MRDINLIPPDTLEGHRIARRVRFWITVNLAALVLLVGVFGITAWSAHTANEALWRLDSRLAELRRLTEDLEALKSEGARLSQEEAALAALLDRTSDCRLLSTLTGAVVDDGWLTRLEFQRPVGETRANSSGELLLEGHAGSYAHLARLMAKLDTLEFVAAVSLRSSQRTRAEEMDVIRFDLECPLARGPRGAEGRQAMEE